MKAEPGQGLGMEEKGWAETELLGALGPGKGEKDAELT